MHRIPIWLCALALCVAAIAARAQALPGELQMNVIQETATFRTSDIASVEVTTDHTGSIVIEIVLTPDAAKSFATLTEKSVGKPMQLVVGDRILTTPLIREPIRGGRLQISGNLTKADAEAIAAKLR